MFYGIIIRMYFAPGEHPPPHFHVYYAEYTATVDIRTCELIEGTAEEANKAYSSAPGESESDTLALKKIASFYGWKE